MIHHLSQFLDSFPHVWKKKLNVSKNELYKELIWKHFWLTLGLNVTFGSILLYKKMMTFINGKKDIIQSIHVLPSSESKSIKYV